ncbi:MAG: radical SAM family heme chaperone HemW [Desulfobaccales bacterium]
MAPLSGLYVHVPFCQSKCPYCDFFSITSAALIPAYLSALDKEAKIYAQKPANAGTGVPSRKYKKPVKAQTKACGYQNSNFSSFDTLFLGGGTPSLLSGAQIAGLVQGVRRHLSFASAIEFTLEANPDDISREKLLLWRDLGVNRLSLGAQSFDEAELAFLKRRHTAAQTLEAVSLIRAAGFENLGLDLIYGLPGQTPDAWLKTLKQALVSAPEHLSCYQLTLAPGTPLSRRAAGGRLALPDEETQRALFLLTCEFLTGRGFLQYEVANFARGEEYRCRHNLKYWRRQPYLGLGPAAHSFQGGRRWWNHRGLSAYAAALAAGRAPRAGHEALTPEQVRLETLYLGFRTREGVDLKVIESHSGWGEVLSRLQDEGLLRLTGGRVAATPRGLVIADRLPLLFVN